MGSNPKAENWGILVWWELRKVEKYNFTRRKYSADIQLFSS